MCDAPVASLFETAEVKPSREYTEDLEVHLGDQSKAEGPIPKTDFCSIWFKKELKHFKRHKWSKVYLGLSNG